MSDVIEANDFDEITPVSTDFFYGIRPGRTPREEIKYSSNILGMSANKVITVTTGSSITQIQELLNAEPQDLNGYTLTVQFQDGTYSITTPIDLSGFSNGTLNFSGNSADSTLSSSKSVKLIGTDGNRIIVKEDGALCNLAFRYLQFDGFNPVTGSIVLTEEVSCLFLACAFGVAGGTPSTGIFFRGMNSRLLTNQFTGLDRAIEINTNANIHVSNTNGFSTNTIDILSSGGFASYSGNIVTDSLTISTLSGGNICDVTGWIL